MKYRKGVLLSLILIIVIAVIALDAKANTVTIVNSTSGWYTNNGIHTPGNTNYLAGDSVQNPAGTHYRNFFVFNLASLSGTVSSARLELWTYEVDPQGGVYTLFDVSTNPAILQTTSNSLTIYSDLGTGSSFGSISLDGSATNSLITINLNAAAIAAIQASSGGLFGIGGDYIGGPINFQNVAFGNSEFDQRNRLIIETESEVPEPTTMLLLLTGLSAFVPLARRQRTNR